MKTNHQVLDDIKQLEHFMEDYKDNPKLVKAVRLAQTALMKSLITGFELHKSANPVVTGYNDKYIQRYNATLKELEYLQYGQLLQAMTNYKIRTPNACTTTARRAMEDAAVKAGLAARTGDVVIFNSKDTNMLVRF